jgi:hypothetical protein
MNPTTTPRTCSMHLLNVTWLPWVGVLICRHASAWTLMLSSTCPYGHTYRVLVTVAMRLPTGVDCNRKVCV